jgi:putative hemolysin
VITAFIAVVVLVATAGFLAAAETALTNVPRVRAMALVDAEEKGAERLLRLLERRDRALNPVLLLVLVCHLLAATIVGLEVESHLGPIGILVAILVEVVVIFVFAEAVPKTYALEHPDRVALFVAPFVDVLVGFPPVRLLTRGLIGLSNVVLPGKGRKTGPSVSEEDLLALADVAVEAGEIESGERALIRSIIDFGDTVAREVMVPRPDMVTISADATVHDAMEIAITRGYSRVPAIGDGGIDDVVGVVHAKDLMRAMRDRLARTPVRPLLRPAAFVPETKRVSELLKEMQARRAHLAIVVDEYGGTAGLVTLEDLIEELVGEIVDEFDNDDPLLEPLPNGDWRVSARLSLDEVNELLRLDLPEGDWDTLAGLVFNALGHVPNEGEAVEIDGHRLRAERVDGRRIERIRITRAPRT